MVARVFVVLRVFCVDFPCSSVGIGSGFRKVDKQNVPTLDTFEVITNV